MRRIPTNGPAPLTLRAQLDRVSETRTYTLITPLFGGGVEPRAPDPVTVIRGASIRGHLRFWWRFCMAHRFATTAELKAAEDLLWGAAHADIQEATSAVEPGDQNSAMKRPAPVSLRVEILNPGSAVRAYNVVSRNGRLRPIPNQECLAPPYASFPLQPAERECVKVGQSTATVQQGIRFRLTITMPTHDRQRKYPEEVQAALWAWETFGGIGGRNRRGFGALRLDSLARDGISTVSDLPPAEAPAARRWLEREFEKRIVATMPEPNASSARTLGLPRIELKSSPGSAEVCWSQAITALQRFRQQRRPPENNIPGRSYWPEPDAIRRCTGQRSPRHRYDVSSVNKFPRAAFGLPIVFHFKDNGEPADTVLKSLMPDAVAQTATHVDRWASPLLLRPLACRNNQYLPMAVLLPGRAVPLERLVLTDKLSGQAISQVKGDLTANEVSQLRGNSDRLNLSGSDVLEAFLNFFAPR